MKGYGAGEQLTLLEVQGYYRSGGTYTMEQSATGGTRRCTSTARRILCSGAVLEEETGSLVTMQPGWSTLRGYRDTRVAANARRHSVGLKQSL